MRPFSRSSRCSAVLRCVRRTWSGLTVLLGNSGERQVHASTRRGRRKTVVEWLAQPHACGVAVCLAYEADADCDLPAEAVHNTKRMLIDIVGVRRWRVRASEPSTMA